MGKLLWRTSVSLFVLLYSMSEKVDEENAQFLFLFVLVISLDIFFLHLYCRFLRRILQRLINGGVEQMYTEMASRHRVRFPCIQIIKTATIPAKICKMESTKQFHNSKIKFPLVFKKV
ncbi:60S ribosomal protein L18a-2-like [Fagus crenata]